MHLRVCVRAQMSVSNKAAGGVGWGASLCLPTPPHPVRVTECAAMMCPLAKPTASLFSRSVSPSPALVSLYTLHNVHLSPPLLLSCYYIVDNVIPALSGCLIVPSVTPRIYLRLPHPSP